MDRNANGTSDQSSERSIQYIRTRFPEFCDRIRERLIAGATEYGDASFSRKSDELLEEIQQELLDVCGWAWILYERLDVIKKQIETFGNFFLENR
ncbi:MAG: hypothetical protein N3A02_01425 [Rectinema sp.]|nr:hypothetical protein [Rectinema sp.]